LRISPNIQPSSGPAGPGAHPRIPGTSVHGKKDGPEYGEPAAALRFFFVKTLRRPWNADETPYPRKVVNLPVILSREEVAHLIDSAVTAFHRVILMTLYGTGVRRAELTHPNVSDIDSDRMVVHVKGGKGRKDRDVMLSVKLLEALREHWVRYKPKEWLFPGGVHHKLNHPITTKVVWHACRQAAKRAGLEKKVYPHILRHCFATHLLEAGTDLYYPVRCERRDSLLLFAMVHGRDLAAQHLRNCADLPRFREFYRPCPNARAAAREPVLLPTYPRYPATEIQRNIQVIRKFFGT
jgi:integrase